MSKRILGKTEEVYKLKDLSLEPKGQKWVKIITIDDWAIRCCSHEKGQQNAPHALHTENAQMNSMIDLQANLGSAIADNSYKNFQEINELRKEIKSLREDLRETTSNNDYLKNLMLDLILETKQLKELKKLKNPKPIEIETKHLAEKINKQQEQIESIIGNTKTLSEDIFTYLKSL